MRKLLFILPLLLFLGCSSENEPIVEEGGEPQPKEWLKDKLLMNGIASNVTTYWEANDTLIAGYWFNSKYVDVLFYSKGGGYISLDGKWRVERINRLIIQDNRHNLDYSEYIVEPVNKDSTRLSLTGVGEYEGRNLEIKLWWKYESWVQDKLLIEGIGANIRSRWDAYDTDGTLINSYWFNYEDFYIRYYSTDDVRFNRQWYIDSEDHLYLQDIRGKYNYSEYAVQPLNEDSTHLRLTGIGEYEGKELDFYLFKDR